VRIQEGTGEITITGPDGTFDISYFITLTHREQLLFPFKVVDRVNKFDLDIKVNLGGMSCLAKAIRFGISRALCCFVSTDQIEKLRLGRRIFLCVHIVDLLFQYFFYLPIAGLLNPDRRMKERKKPGQEGARKKYKWFGIIRFFMYNLSS
jgi:small subunit ribosomal protein S9